MCSFMRLLTCMLSDCHILLLAAVHIRCDRKHPTGCLLTSIGKQRTSKASSAALSLTDSFGKSAMRLPMDSLSVELAALSRLGSKARRVWGLLLPASSGASSATQQRSQGS